MARLVGLHCPNSPGPRSLFFLQLLLLTIRDSAAEVVEPQLLDNLTRQVNYDIRVRPDAETGKPVTVITNAYVYFIGSIDAQNLEFSAQILVRHSWHDPRLRFDRLINSTGAQLEGEEWLRRKVWVPSVYFVNERERVTEENVYLAIQPNGTVQYNYRVKLRIFCAMRLHKFPFDKQRCTLIMESWMYSVADLLLEWTPFTPAVEVNTHASLPEYKLIRTSTNVSVNMYPKSAPGSRISGHPRQNGEFSALLIHFDFEREVGHYIMDYYVPSILLVVMSWVSFWLDPNAVPGRTTLGTSTMLTFITLTRNTGSSLPKVSYIKAVEIWFIVCAAFIFGSLVEFAFVNSIWRRRKNVQLKKVNSKYILKSTLTPKMARKNYASDKTISNGDLHSLSCSLDQCPSASSQQLTVTSLDSALSVSNCRLSVASCNDMEGETVVSLAVPGGQPQSTMVTSPSGESMDSVHHLSPNKSFFTMTPQEIAAWIDRRSRVLFPAGFVLFNILYWSMVWL